MAMHDPPHPGELTVEVCLEPNRLSGRELATLAVAAVTCLARWQSLPGNP